MTPFCCGIARLDECKKKDETITFDSVHDIQMHKKQRIPK